MAERLACSPLTKGDPCSIPGRALPDPRMWESCWTMSCGRLNTWSQMMHEIRLGTQEWETLEYPDKTRRLPATSVTFAVREAPEANRGGKSLYSHVTAELGKIKERNLQPRPYRTCEAVSGYEAVKARGNLEKVPAEKHDVAMAILSMFTEIWGTDGMKGRGEMGDPRENPPTSFIVRHDSHLRKIRSEPVGESARFAFVGGEQSNRSATAAPSLWITALLIGRGESFRADGTAECRKRAGSHSGRVGWLAALFVAPRVKTTTTTPPENDVGRPAHAWPGCTPSQTRSGGGAGTKRGQLGATSRARPRSPPLPPQPTPSAHLWRLGVAFSPARLSRFDHMRWRL
ncbi:hypothetical protein PR048_029995 [Dryococelus australis]|uniref:Uncharacterized protein n=1 Tax=Dryococelus australis TaxID=614101 RepID=A0ABQ9GAG0_9NEOP|nr:hypothetical protein PR048_029995 [Dryococelus australis]